MSFQERRAFASLVATVLGSTLYYAEVLRGFLNRDVSLSDDFAFWGKAILVFIPAMVVFKVIVLIIFYILNAIATRIEEPDITDERDRIIELKATRNFYHVFMLGFVLSMGVLALGAAPTVMFIVLMFSMLASGAMLDISQIYYYRRGV